MARTSTVARLYSVVEPSAVENLSPIGEVPLNEAQARQLPVRTRFARRREEAEAYTLDAPAAIMGSVPETVYADRSRDFAVLAARDAVRALMLRSGGAFLGAGRSTRRSDHAPDLGFAPPWVAARYRG